MADDTEEPFDDDLIGAEPEARLHPVLTNKQVLEARANARKKIDAERVKAAMAAMEAEEVERLRHEEGYTTGTSFMDEIVSVTIDVPPWMVVSGSATGLVVNGRPFHYGHSYDVPRHVANSLRESMFYAWRLDDQVEGRDLRQHYATKRNTAINARTGTVERAPVRFDA